MQEENLRIMHIALLQSKPRKQGAAAMTIQLAVADNPTCGTPSPDAPRSYAPCRLSQNEADPTLFATAYKRNRFFLFTKREAQEIGGEVCHFVSLPA